MGPGSSQGYLTVKCAKAKAHIIFAMITFPKYLNLM